jgi:hypothetical protein
MGARPIASGVLALYIPGFTIYTIYMKIAKRR